MTPDRRATLPPRLTLFLAMALSWVLVVRADPIISEFMAANTKVLADDDEAFSDWLELHNPDAQAVNLAGWYLTDAAGNKTKWQLPAVTIPAGGFILVFASNKDRTNPSAALHTNFALSASGEYLGLIRPDGSVASEFAPGFPAQSDNISYGRVVGEDGAVQTGFLRQPTPGAANGGTDALLLVETVAFSQPSGIFADTLTVELSGASAGQEIRYVAAKGPDASNAKITAESPVYTEPLVLDATTVVRAAVFSGNGAVQGAMSTAHYLKTAAGLAEFSSKLPVLVLDNFGAGALEKDGIDHPSWMYGFGASNSGDAITARSPDFTSPFLMTVRGSSSAAFLKKGYNVKMRDPLGNKRDVPLFGLPAYERWALVAPWSFDQNFINNSFVYELSNRIGRWAPRTRLAEVFFNTGADDLDTSDYAGIYVISDRIRVEKGRVDIQELSASDVSGSAVTGGYIVKIDAPDEDEIGWRTEHGVPASNDTSIVLVAPDADDIVPAQVEYIQTYLQRMENALHADHASGFAQRTYLDYIDRPSWVDHHLLNVLVSNPDALHRSAYFTKPRDGKLQAGPVWDFDRALGAYWDERSNVVETWSGIGGKVDFWASGWWGILAKDPEFVQAWIDRWQSLRNTQLSTTALTALAQSLANTVGEDAAARDAARWPDNESVYGSYPGQIDALKNWLTRRSEWIDAQFAARPTMSTESGGLTFTPPEGALLAYTLDGTDPRMLGGAIAPNAQVTSSPLSLATSANVHVRSYHPAAPDTVPGSPWSSIVSGPSATALAPHARLSNVSTRAVVGSDANMLVLGLGVADTEVKRYLARAIGPGLAAFGTSNTISDPQLSLRTLNGPELQRNAGWQTHAAPAQLQAAARSVGAFQLADASADSAMLADLAPGAYAIEISTPSAVAGIGLAELFELDTSGRTTRLTMRGRVTSENALIGGFVVQGAARKRLLIRAVGPSLADLGLADLLADPVLILHSSSAVVATNDRWRSDENALAIELAGERAGAVPLSSESDEAALLVTLPAGAYTVEVKGKEGAQGLARLEIYDLP